MTVKLNDWASVRYEGSFSSGEVFDKNDEKNPLYFQVGAGQVIKGFEDAVLNMKSGDEKTVKIKAKDAYGEKNTLVTEIPKEAFAGQDLKKIPLNTELQIMSNMGPMVIEIKEIGKDKIKAIINHPMSGKDLTFKIKLLKVLDKKEVESLMKDMRQHSCGCGCEHEHSHNHEHSCECEDECSCEKEHKHKSEHKSKEETKKKGKK